MCNLSSSIITFYKEWKEISIIWQEAALEMWKKQFSSARRQKKFFIFLVKHLNATHNKVQLWVFRVSARSFFFLLWSIQRRWFWPVRASCVESEQPNKKSCFTWTFEITRKVPKSEYESKIRKRENEYRKSKRKKNNTVHPTTFTINNNNTCVRATNKNNWKRRQRDNTMHFVARWREKRRRIWPIIRWFIWNCW